MKIDHIALNVYDLEGAKLFFEKFFNGHPNQEYHNPKTGLRTYFITFPDGGKLEIMSRPGMVHAADTPLRSGYIHLSFSVGSREKVDELTSTLVASGYEAIDGPRLTGDGFYESSVLGFENNLIEITE